MFLKIFLFNIYLVKSYEDTFYSNEYLEKLENNLKELKEDNLIENQQIDVLHNILLLIGDFYSRIDLNQQSRIELPNKKEERRLSPDINTSCFCFKRKRKPLKRLKKNH